TETLAEGANGWRSGCGAVAVDEASPAKRVFVGEGLVDELGDELVRQLQVAVAGRAALFAVDGEALGLLATFDGLPAMADAPLGGQGVGDAGLARTSHCRGLLRRGWCIRRWPSARPRLSSCRW